MITSNTNHITHWDRRYFDLATHVAQWSKDPSTKVGAVIVGLNRRNVAIGYNGFPPPIADTPERYADRELKYAYVQHAERNVLDNATFDCTDATLATTMFPCVECAKSIISKGVRRLITPLPPEPLPGQPSWRDTCRHSVNMFNEARVRCVWME